MSYGQVKLFKSAFVQQRNLLLNKLFLFSFFVPLTVLFFLSYFFLEKKKKELIFQY